MNGQLTENPLAELIREILFKRLSGRLKLQLNRVQVAIYFQSGSLVYAACNIRTFRLAEYLLKSNLISSEDLLYLGRQTQDLDLVKTLVSENRISETQAQEQQRKQVSDILLLPLAWTEGTWEFDHRSHLDKEVNFSIDLESLLIEASRHLPLKFTASRFQNAAEIISPAANQPNVENLLPAEVFLLSRVEAPILLSELVAISGLPELEALRVVYSLALVGLITRQHWKNAFRGSTQPVPTAPKQVPRAIEQCAPTENADDIEVFLERLSSAGSYYDLLSVAADATPVELKSAYYNIARKYHPDLYRGTATTLLARIESAFARITQAYDTLRDPGLRASYDSKLDAKRRTAKLAESAPKAPSSVAEKPGPKLGEEPKEDSTLTPAQRAEIQFKEGFAALELGQRNVALGLLGSAARTVSNEPRYRAHYGRALALHESTRRLAESELQAAVKLEPGNAEYRVMLAELYRDLGFSVRAKSEAERAVAADRNNHRARDLLRSLT